MDIYEVFKTRRSIRSYQSRPVPDESLNKILESIRIAPSGSNRQPWKFIIVIDAELKKEVARACSNQLWIADAPIIIVACGWKIDYSRGGYMGDMSFLVDVSIAFTQMILAARAEEIGTCWIGAFDNTKVKKLLEIPEDVDVVAITPLGFPKNVEFTPPGKRKQIDEITSTNKY
ncbi:MAG: nitroreductase [Candidatus Thorarchaeota archaeon]|nr:nitroreductase [Candidatus Thorarchaeota archaeon]